MTGLGQVYHATFDGSLSVDLVSEIELDPIPSNINGGVNTLAPASTEFHNGVVVLAGVTRFADPTPGCVFFCILSRTDLEVFELN